MKKRSLKIALLTGVSIVLFSGFVAAKRDVFFDIAKNIDIFTRVFKEIAFSYVDGVNPEEFMRAGIRGMLNTLDPYTVFIDEKRQEDIDLLTNGKYGGIGITIGLRDNGVTIVEILDGYSAQKQGLQVGDNLIEVNGVTITHQNMDDISSLVKGEPGTFVRLKVLRPGVKDALSFELLREEIKLKNIAYAGFYPENSGIAYIKLTSFNRSAGEELKNTLLELKRQKNIEGIVFDLRNNPGGLLDVAVDIANKFLAKGDLIVSTRGRDSMSLKQYTGSQEPMLKDTKLVVLVNEGSASASEIVAGAIQDHDRGVILGTKSYGKGLVQTIVPLSYNTSLKLTTAKYFTPSGRCIQKINYSKDNKVFAAVDSQATLAFFTDNKRTVYSAGGIAPDTTVIDPDYPEIIKDMLAKGIFFKFVNRLIEKSEKGSLEKLSDQELFTAFTTFCTDEKYSFLSELGKKVDELVTLSAKTKKYSGLTPEFAHIKSELSSQLAAEMSDAKPDILLEIKIEIASRSKGNEGRIKTALQDDPQFSAALHILRNEIVYKNLLRKK
jgi:carboxyl-terminal processing protease